MGLKMSRIVAKKLPHNNSHGKCHHHGQRNNISIPVIGGISKCGWCGFIFIRGQEDDEESENVTFSGTRLQEGSMFLCIPQEIRVKIFAFVPQKDRRSVRLLCKQLTWEIDIIVGPSEYMYLNEEPCKKVQQFYARSLIPGIKISRPAIWLFNVQSVVGNPLKITTIKISKGGIVTSQFVTDLLTQCSNLRHLVWSGQIKGLVNPYEKEIELPKLKSLIINSTDMSSSHLLESHLSGILNVLHGLPFDLNSVMAFWNNQTSLIRRFYCPILERCTLFLYTCENTSLEDCDETELLHQILRFLSRHKHLKSLRLYHAQRPIFDSRHMEYRHPLTFFNRNFQSFQDLQPEGGEHSRDFNGNYTNYNLTDCALKEFTFSSRLNCQFHNNHERNFETFVLKFLSSIRGLSEVKYSGTKGRSLMWANVEKIVRSNFNTLVVIDIVGKIDGNIDFGAIAHCQHVRVIRINNKQKYRHASLSPIIRNFGPHQNIKDGLETLVLQNIGLSWEDFESLPSLKRLKHLCIYRWRCGPGEQSLTFNGIRGVLNMRTLDALLVPWPRVFVYDAGNASDKEREWIQKITLALNQFMHPKDARRLCLLQYLCIQDDSRGLWTKNEWGFKIKTTFMSPQDI